MSLDLDDPSAREAASGPARAFYRHKGVPFACPAWACKKDGAMGAAFVFKDGLLRTRVSLRTDPRPSSVRSSQPWD